LFHVTPVSVQVVLVPANTPPTAAAFVHTMWTFADTTVPAPMPDTVNFIRKRFAGLPSTSTVVSVPKFCVGLSDRIVASAVTANVAESVAVALDGELIVAVASRITAAATVTGRRGLSHRTRGIRSSSPCRTWCTVSTEMRHSGHGWR
jgi:hypothetical protein